MRHTCFKTSAALFLILIVVSSLGTAAVTPATEILQQWQNKGREAQAYKRFFEAVQSDQADAYWKLY
ncbi:MAG: hypothetical protein K2P92_09205, partial [Bdellovibrionaceae bacterium]|nr:hypothetical protein [Pseudobdellovibrionaceae bacterium]